MNYLLLLLGFVFLIKGADFFVDGASSISKKLKIPPMLIGLTIVAFGTSAPEAAVSINASLNNSNEIALGNIIGSNVFNILLVVGVASIIKPINIKIKTILKEFPFMILATIVLFILGNDIALQGNQLNQLSPGDGLILLCIFGVFLYYLVEMAFLTKEVEIENDSNDIKEQSILKSSIIGIVGVAGIIIGSNFVVESSSIIAIQLGMSETLVGLTIIAIGTSLPELVTSIVAAYKGESDIALGNAIGSNLFNVLFILGVSSVINPIMVDSKMLFDILFLLGATFIAYIIATTKKTSSRFEGVFLIFLYITYMIFIIIRN
ncbi:calcium/sodium antiporter [Clostridium sp. D2Q-11]|uniref:Calcium/sodium antiporter n=1 Tax=Anaeromonas frigoriresistens TaxID=2683708 RepID=A0A942V196_9FIRM|nr:calcium/sodium antiporter [Anaeromonas frigoriresistens]MBS4539337.1 calcium/sodium antiporter [Anaeromonas frigoriresistens]